MKLKLMLFLSLITFFLIAAITQVAATSYFDPGTKLVNAYWKFNQTSNNATDFIDGVHNLTAVGSVNYVAGLLGNAGNTTLLAGSTNTFSYPADAFMNLDTDDFTYSIWFKRPALTDTGDSQTTPTIFYKHAAVAGNNTHRWYAWFDRTQGGKIDIYFGGNSHRTTGTYDNNIWQHLVVTRNAGNLTYYINGTPLYSNISDVDLATGGSLYVGSVSDAHVSGDSEMLIDNFVYFDEGVDYDYVQTLYNSGNGVEMTLSSPPNIISSYITAFDTSVYETQSNNFFLNVTLLDDTMTGVSSILRYNNTEYPMAIHKKSLGNVYYFNTTISAPQTTTATNYTFFYEIITANSTDIYDYNTTNFGQYVNPIDFYVCNSSASNQFLNFTFVDELTGTALDGTKNATNFAATFNYTYGGSQKSYSYENATSTANSYSFCGSPPYGSLIVDMNLEYSAGGYSPRNWYLRSSTLTNETNEIDLYLIPENEGTKFYLEVRGASGLLEGVIVTILKYFDGTGTYQAISTRRTDKTGRFVEYLEEDKDYRYIVVQNNVTLGSVEKTALCPTSPCEDYIQLPLSDVNIWDILDEYIASNVNYDLSYNKTTDLITLDFVDTTGTAQYIRLKVEKLLFNQTSSSICDSSLYATAGSITCNLSGYTGDFKATGYISRSPEKPFIWDYFTKNIADFGATGLIIAFFIIVTIGFVGLFNPVVAMALLIVGLIFIFIMDLAPIGLTSLIALVVLFVIVIIKLRT